MNAINYSAHFLVLLLLVLPLLDQANAQTGIGSSCTISSGAGVCRLITNCPYVYNNLLVGIFPEKTCSYLGLIPIVCCPNITPTTTTTTTTTRNPLINARPARRMCAQYAKSVYALQTPPVSGGPNTQVNVSLCAITGKTLIVGGTKADPKEFPHMAAVGYNSGSTIRWDCGGTLISDSYVLTAAHCLNSPQWGAAQWVRVGDLNVQSTTDNAQPQDRRIIQRIPHPSYQRPAQYNDIALLKLQQPVTFNAYVRPACLDTKGIHVPGERAVATGWGIVDWFDDTGSPDLLKVIMPVVSYANCAPFYSDDTTRLPNGINNAIQMCAGANGKDTCQGDSGGPLAIYSTDEFCMYDVIGVTNFGQLCGSNTPGVYSRVYSYLSWIESIVWPTLG